MRIRFLIVAFTVCIFGLMADEPKHSVKPEAGFVPDERTAIAIAVAVWTPIYGDEKIQKEKPFKAKLKDSVWYVNGTLANGFNKGGVAEAEISKDDARILRISHGK
jgi:hypothetical protein